MRGCSVLTRPPSISGACVTSSTAVTGSPCSSRYAAVPAARDELEPELVEAARELVEARLVVDGDQRAHAISSRTTVGRSRCSTAWIRSTSVRARLDRDDLLTDDVAAVDAFVHEVDGNAGLVDAGSECIVDRMRPRKIWQQRRMHVDDPAGKRSRNGAVSRCMYPARTTSSTPCSSSHVAMTRSRSSRVAWQSSENVAVGMPAAARAVECTGVSAVRRDGDDRQSCVDQRLQVRPFARDEDADHVAARSCRSRARRRRAPRRSRSSRCRG